MTAEQQGLLNKARESVKAARLLDGLDRRTEVDYDIDPDVTDKEASEMIQQAEQFIALAEQHLA